jgi:hypothetical protein
MDNGYWEKEEFEDLVARGLIALYENKMNKKCKKVPKYLKVNDKDFAFIKSLGLYFSPYDRESMKGEVDLINDGLPKIAFRSDKPFSHGAKKVESYHLKTEYLRSWYLIKLTELPKPFLNHERGTVYKQIIFQATASEQAWLQKSYVVINQNGQIYDSFVLHPQTREEIYLPIGIFTMPDGDSIETDILGVSLTIGLYQDRKYLWNVTAKENIAKATFGVYPEQIKSLFYARELPMTETGRKRPILHWVKAHQRRLKAGIDIDIEKHLRGINEFVYQGTKFIITRPIKECLKSYATK